MSDNNKPGDQQGTHHILGDARFFYYPIWSVRENEVFSYLCEVFWNVGADHLLSESELSGQFQDSSQLLALDLETINKAIGQADEIAAQIYLLKVMIPVHFKTLADPENGEAYIKACNKLVWPFFEGISFEIINVPNTVTDSRLSDTADRIRPFGQNVFLRVSPDFTNFMKIPPGAFQSIGMDLRSESAPDDELSDLLTAFAEQTDYMDIQRHVHGLKTTLHTVAALNAGYDFIGSDTILVPMESQGAEMDLEQSARLMKTLMNTLARN